MCNTWFKCNKLGSLCLALKDRELECPGDSDLPDFCQRRSRVCLALSIWVLVLEERGVGESSGGKWINQLPESQERDRIINPSVTFTSLSCHWRTHSLSRIVAPPPHTREVLVVLWPMPGSLWALWREWCARLTTPLSLWRHHSSPAVFKHCLCKPKGNTGARLFFFSFWKG